MAVFVVYSFNKKHSYIPTLYDFSRAYQSKIINKDTFYYRILMSDALHELTLHKTGGKNYDVRKDFNFLKEVVDQCINRVLELELVRGGKLVTGLP